MGLSGDSGVDDDGGDKCDAQKTGGGVKRPLIAPNGDGVDASTILADGPPLLRRRLDFK